MTNFDNIFYIGVNDHKIDLFEGQYVVPNGMAYNSYIIMDQQIAVMDTVDHHFCNEWLNNLEKCLNGKTPNYLIVQHMEMDHAGSIVEFMDKYPSTKIVASAQAFVMMKNFFGKDFADRRIVTAEKSTLSLGEHTLTFVMAPMVHWPEVMMTYDDKAKTLFSADGFGKFGALDINEDWACEARRYYFGIVGKYGMQVQNVLKKLAGIEVKRICPLHGPVLSENLSYYLDLYNIWSSYKPEKEGVVIAYTSVYGNTKKAVEILEKELKQAGCKDVAMFDLARCDMAEAVEDAFKYNKLVLATTTYNADIFPFMKEFINHLTERNYQNRKIALIENGSWAPAATRVMKSMLEKCTNIAYSDINVKIMSAVNEQNMIELKNLAIELSK